MILIAANIVSAAAAGAGAAVGVGAGTIAAIVIGLLIFIISIIITLLVIKLFKVRKTVTNIITIFAGVFGILTSFLFLYYLR